MIDLSNITGEWIKKASGANQKADKILIEKVIRALALLEGLAKQDISFVFKGGTALMLHLDSGKRLSIDIDIILPKGTEMKEEWLNRVVETQGFIRWELQHRNANSNIQKEHYKFFYTPLNKTNKTEEQVLLDILFEDTLYNNLQKLPVKSPFIPQSGEAIEVTVPSVEDLLGDKLTAFAPKTTGIPYFKNDDSMSLEIIKQLYDIGTLFDLIQDMEVVKKTFHAFAIAELSYRGNPDQTPASVLEDIYQTALAIVTRGMDGEADFEELQSGIQRITSFIHSEKFHLEIAITHASKGAYVATLIEQDAGNIERFDNPMEIKEWVIEEPMNTWLNKLKKSNPEAFFYWYKIFEFKKDLE